LVRDPGRGDGGHRGVYAGCAAISALLFALLASSLIRDPRPPGDAAVYGRLSGYEDTAVISGAVDVFSSEALVYALGALSLIVVAILLACGRRLDALFFGLAVGGALTTPLLKDAFAYRGPPEDGIPSHVFSFPSGHATASMAIAAAIVILAWRTRFRAPALLLGGGAVLVIGLAVVVDGVHWPSDVLGGWLAAVCWTCIVAFGLDSAAGAAGGEPEQVAEASDDDAASSDGRFRVRDADPS
jgi:membrane-associated phospholipid phosphatase